jgi:hypothetical protein
MFSSFKSWKYNTYNNQTLHFMRFSEKIAILSLKKTVLVMQMQCFLLGMEESGYGLVRVISQ